MKKNRFFAILLSVILILSLSVSTAFATSILDGAKSFFGILGGDDVDSNQVNSVLDSLFGNGSSVSLSDLLSGDGLDTIRGLLGGDANGASDSALSEAISSLLGGNSSITSDLLNEDMLGKIADYLAAENVTVAEDTTGAIITTEPATEPTTEEPTTEASTTQEPTTEESTTQKNSSYYNGAATYTTSAYTYTTVPVTEATATYEYVPAVSETVTELVPTDFTPVVYDSDDGASDGVSAKMIIGIILLVLSGGAVIAVAIILKKNRV